MTASEAAKAQSARGPLAGIRVVEFAAVGPGPFCGMMLADMGAELIRIDRTVADWVSSQDPEFDFVARGRRSVAVDLKKPGACALVLELLDTADALIEGYRPGVMESLGLGPEVCLARNPRLVYGRMTGWGQSGPLAPAAGHDLNYIALSGVLHAIGPGDRPPTVPLNLIGDYGGGGMMLAFGLVCALLEARSSGRGQVIDAAMTDGSALLGTSIYAMHAAGAWSTRRQSNLLDGSAHFYGCYACADGRFIALGSIEPQFHALLLQKLGVGDAREWQQFDARRWPEYRRRLEAIIATRTRDEWCRHLEGSDVCFAPVLDLEEAPYHGHNRARETFVEYGGHVQPAPAPRLSRTPGSIRRPAPQRGEHTVEILREAGLSETRIAELRAAGVIA